MLSINFTITLARRGVKVQYTRVCELQSGSLNHTALLVFSQTPDSANGTFGASLDRPGRGCGCTSGTCYITRDVGSLRFERVHKERAHHWQAWVDKVARARFSKHTWRKARLRMLVVRSGASKRTVCKTEAYVGVEHWRHLHSWPCDRNRNEGNICSSQQQCRTVRYCVYAYEVTKRTEGYQDCHHGVLLGDGQDEVSKQSVSWFGQLSIRSRTLRYCVLCEPAKKLGDRTFFTPGADSRADRRRSRQQIAPCLSGCHQSSFVTEKWTGRCLVACLGDMEPCDPTSTHKIVQCSPEARVK